MNLEPNIHYIVTHPGDDGTLVAGDHITLQDNGDLMCDEAAGWIDAYLVPEAMKGVEVVVDADVYQRARELLLSRLASLEETMTRLGVPYERNPVST